ncbi:MAG TPA: copper chaperone PCu(A)C [Usitatibacter sp.]|jgi:periplasmic copper chaperone A|nr:copper chaperone PCu(A)C [Usitatibacter sp.]
MDRRSHALAAVLAISLAGSAHATVVARDAWVRGMLPILHETVAYVTLTSTEDAKIVAVSTPLARRAQMHASNVTGGVMHMEVVDTLALPADTPVQLKPGGTHVMLMEVARMLKPGDTVPIEFTIENAKGQRSKLEVKALVRPLAE